jgi:hypothetical protein
MCALRETIANPDLELVGLRVFSPDKVGVDAGTIAGLEPVGVVATDSREEILALDADVVIHCSQPFGDMEAMHDDVCALLRSGKNVISVAYYMAPELHGEQFTRRLAGACREGNSTLHGTGVNPGFLCDRLPATLTGLMMDIQQIRTLEAADLREHPNPGMVIDLLGFGMEPEKFRVDPATNPDLAYCALIFPEAQHRLFSLLGITLDRIEPMPPKLSLASRDLVTAAGPIKAGTIAGITWTFNAYREGDPDDHPFSVQAWSWYVEAGLDGMPECDGGYQARIEIDGRPTMRIVVDFTDKEDPIFLPTAAAALHAIPAVVDAPAGQAHSTVFGAWAPRARTLTPSM